MQETGNIWNMNVDVLQLKILPVDSSKTSFDIILEDMQQLSVALLIILTCNMSDFRRTYRDNAFC